MQKINFKNLPSTDTPIDATNLNLLQDNVENALFSGDYDDLTNKPTIPTIENSLDSDSTTDAPSVHAVKTLKPVELYSESSGATGTITLSDNYTNYSKLEITTSLGTYIYNCNMGPTDLIINRSMFYDMMYIDYMRITFTNDNKVNVTDSGGYYQNANHTTTNNKIYKVVGYK